MGSTFGNMNILAVPDLTRDVIESKFVGMAGIYVYRRAEKPDESGYSIIVFYDKRKKWICVYDERLEESGPDEALELTRIYSKWLEQSVVTSLVYDSDAVVMCLSGKEDNDLYCSIPELVFEDPYEYDPGQMQGHIEKWRGLLVDDSSEKELAALWQNTDFVFAEEKLGQIGKLLGFDEQLCGLGYQYYQDVSGELDLSNYEIINIHFQKNIKRK